MNSEYYKRLIVTMDNYHKGELLKALQKNNFTVAGFKDIKKVNENHILGALKKSIKNRECYIKSIVEVYPELKDCDVVKLDNESYIETLINEKNKQGVIALLIKEAKGNKEFIERLIDKYLPNTEILKETEDKINKKNLISDTSIVNEKNDFKNINKELSQKVKNITQELKQKETTIYSQKDTIEKNKKEINTLCQEIENLKKENESLSNAINLEKTTLAELTKKYNALCIEYTKKKILIIGIPFKTKISKHLNIVVKSEEIFKNVNILDIVLDIILDGFDELWIIESEISSYVLKRSLKKQQKNDNRVKLFKNPSEIKLHIKEIDKNGVL